MADTEGTVLKKYRPAALIDAILAKKNLGTTREMADLPLVLDRDLWQVRMWIM